MPYNNTYIELNILEAVMEEDEEYANQLVENGMFPTDRARLAMYCSTIIRMCMRTWEKE